MDIVTKQLYKYKNSELNNIVRNFKLRFIPNEKARGNDGMEQPFETMRQNNDLGQHQRLY